MRRVPVRPGDDEDAVKKTFVRVLLLIAAVATLTLIFQVVCDAARVEASEVMLRWTNPSTQADTLDCTQAGTSPETMGSVWFDVVRIPQGDTLSLGSKNVAGKEGLPDSITVDIADSIRYVEFIVWTVDAAGNRSCLKNHLLEAILPDTTVTPPLPTNAGLFGSYYQGIAFNALFATRVDSIIDFPWGYGEALPGLGVDKFSVRWAGSIVVPTYGIWTLYVASDDGSRLAVDGTLRIDRWTNQSESEASWSGVLDVGEHPILLEYYDDGFNAVVRFRWEGPGVAKQIVPAWGLVH